MQKREILMKSIRFNDLSKASQIFAESFVEKEPKIKSRKNLNESIKNKPLKENYSIVDLETGERKERKATNEALSDEAKANNEMIQKILNKKPSQLTAKEKKILADNDLVRYDGEGGYYRPNIRKNGASWSSGIRKGDSFIINRNNLDNLTATNIDDVDQLNLLKKRDERSRARYEADKDPDILEPQNYPGLQGKSKLQVFNKNYEKDIKGSKRYAKNARDFMDSYIETGGRFKADLARHNADASRVLKNKTKKSLEHRPKFESINEPHGEYFKKGSRS